MSEILVLGSNSFSGAAFVKYALSKGINVSGVSRSNEPIDELLPYKWNDYSNFNFFKLDLNNNLELIMDLISLKKPKYVINFAAQSMVAESWQNPGHWFQTNTLATVEFHEQLRKLNFISKYVHVSTPEVYGDCSGFVNEKNNFNPSTPYAVSRAAADMSLISYGRAYNFPFVITRAANVYGAGQSLYRIIPRTILYILTNQKLQLHGGGVSTRSFIHIDDVADATWRIMEKGTCNETYHISTSEIVSIRRLVEIICKKLDVDFFDCVDLSEERLGKDSSYQLDCSKVKKELDWKDKINLDVGLDLCIDWVKSNLQSLKTGPLSYVHKQ
jgi:dTDP-glucose 4,6-dehydratase